MKLNKFQIIVQGIVFTVLLCLGGLTQAEHGPNIEFFFSNNTNIIDIEKAYKRLNGEAQSELEHTVVIAQEKENA